MDDLNDKSTGDNLSAPEWNQLPSEIQNVIEGLSQTLSGADLNQLGKGIAGYVANGDFYTDSGAADAHVLTAIGSKQSPTAYTDGFTARFRAAASNTGATTINVATLGVKNIFSDGAALTGGEITSGELITVVYDNANGRFDLASDLLLADMPLGTTLSLQTEFDLTNSGADDLTVADFSVPSWVKKITIMLSDASISTTATVEILLGDAGGFETSGYSGSSSFITSGGSNTTVNHSSGFVIKGTIVSTDIVQGAVVLTRMNASSLKWAIEGGFSASNTPAMLPLSGSKSLSAALTQVRLVTSAGFFDGGEMNLLLE